MKKIILFVFLLQTLSAFAQLPCRERVEKAGWAYFSILDKVFPQVDSIRYIVSQPFNPENPTVFFLQGSGNHPLLRYGYFGDGRTWNDIWMEQFRMSNYVERYNFVTIAKPGTPICNRWTGQPPLIDTTFGCIWTFRRFDFLNYYVEQLNQVVDDVRKRSNADVPFFFVGNSQGGDVVTAFAVKHPEKVQRLVLKSAGIFGREDEQVFEIRHLMDRGEISSKEAQERINALYKWSQSLKDYSIRFALEDDFDPENTSASKAHHYAIMTHATFTFDIILPRLQNISVPILAVFGTDDIRSRCNDFLPFFFTRWKKNNLTMMPILDVDHHFVGTIIDPETGKQRREFIGNEVFSRIMEWFSKEK